MKHGSAAAGIWSAVAQLPLSNPANRSARSLLGLFVFVIQFFVRSTICALSALPTS